MSQRPYESMVIFDSNLGDAQVEKEIEKIKGFVSTEGGEIGNVDLWGRRKLAYEIEDHKEGYFAVIKFKAEPRIVAPLVRTYRLNEAVLRHNVVMDDLKPPLRVNEDGRPVSDREERESSGRDSGDSRRED